MAHHRLMLWVGIGMGISTDIRTMTQTHIHDKPRPMETGVGFARVWALICAVAGGSYCLLCDCSRALFSCLIWLNSIYLYSMSRTIKITTK